jgi:hypothetical protein
MLLLGAVALGGCGEGEPGAAPAEGAEAPAPREREPPPEPSAVVLDPTSPCGRARACCRAYAEAIPHVDDAVACVGPAEVAGAPDADARCARMVEGWREALERLREGGAPAACRP